LQVTIDAADWLTALPEAETLVGQAADGALAVAAPDLRAAAELGVLLTDDAVSRQLNHRYRGRDQATNVLAFATGEDTVPAAQPLLLGDVVVALGVVLREAVEQHKRPADHLSHLIVHGILHLLGHDHQDDASAAVMEALEVEALARLGIADPYVTPGDRAGPKEVVKA